MELDSGKSTGETIGPQRTCSWNLWVEIVVTSAIIAVVWGLLSLPSVFYFLPRSSGSRISQQGTGSVRACTNYTKTSCLRPLIQIKSYFTGGLQNNTYVEIAANIDQEANENTAQLIISGLPLLGATEMCTSSFIPFMCLYLFPLCDGNGTAHKPSRDQCIEISTMVCKDEWQKAALIPGVIEKLPDCESLSNNTNKVSEQIVPFNTLNKSAPVNATCTQIQCADQFFCSSGTCLPQCGKWKQHDDKDSVALDAMIVISAVEQLGFGISVLILSCIWHNKMFVFPAVIVVYMNMTWITLPFLVLIAFTDRTTLFCSSQSVIEAMKISTPYCSIIGAVYYYTLLQASIWWFCHVIIIFWNIRFPFHAIKNLRTKPIHVTMVLLALLLPTIPVIVSFSTGGFVFNGNPPTLCVSRSSDAAYYSLVLPISIIMATGVSLLVLVIIIVIKLSNAKNQNSTAKIRFGTPEKKLLFLLCYYVFLGSETLVAFAVDSSNSGTYIAAVSHYFACEANGISTSGRCDAERKAFASLNYVELYAMAYILLGLLPAVSLLYVVNFKKVKECICTITKSN